MFFITKLKSVIENRVTHNQNLRLKLVKLKHQPQDIKQ